MKNEDDLYECYKKSETANFYLIKSKRNLNKSDNLNCVGIFDDIKKVNSHWIYFNLISGNGRSTFVLDYNDFNTNEQVSETIATIIGLKNPINENVYIQNDYISFGNIFDKVFRKKIIYCT